MRIKLRRKSGPGGYTPLRNTIEVMATSINSTSNRAVSPAIYRYVYMMIMFPQFEFGAM